MNPDPEAKIGCPVFAAQAHPGSCASLDLVYVECADSHLMGWPGLGNMPLRAVSLL
jgi:hypothetical protein